MRSAKKKFVPPPMGTCGSRGAMACRAILIHFGEVMSSLSWNTRTRATGTDTGGRNARFDSSCAAFSVTNKASSRAQPRIPHSRRRGPTAESNLPGSNERQPAGAQDANSSTSLPRVGKNLHRARQRRGRVRERAMKRRADGKLNYSILCTSLCGVTLYRDRYLLAKDLTGMGSVRIP